MPLSTPLKSGDTIEIITDKNRLPSRDWLKLVKTAKARSRIQHYIRTEERTRAVELGKDMLEKEGRKLSVNAVKAAKDGTLQLLLPEYSLSTLEDLYAAVGYARLTPRKVLNRFVALIRPHEEETPIAPVPKDTPPKRYRKESRSRDWMIRLSISHAAAIRFPGMRWSALSVGGAASLSTLSTAPTCRIWNPNG